VILTPTTSLLRMCKPGNYSGVAPERCLKISTAILSACRCLSNDEISNSIRAIAAINPPSTTGGSLLGLAGNSSGAAAQARRVRLLRPLLPLLSYDIVSTTCAMTKC
jgi:hypothetical protein